jgi:hypothetical protein
MACNLQGCGDGCCKSSILMIVTQEHAGHRNETPFAGDAALKGGSTQHNSRLALRAAATKGASPSSTLGTRAE